MTSEHDTIEQALVACLADSHDDATRATLASFERYHRPDVDEDRLAAFVGARFDDLVALTRSSDNATRHLAAFALGHGRDARAVPHLVAIESAETGDFFDHDFIYRACRCLGEVAVEPLYRIARDETGIPQSVAMQALGQIGLDVWPVLNRLFEAGIRPPVLFTALYNLRDVRALDAVFWGIHSTDEETRDDAVSAAAELLEVAAKQGVLDRLDRPAWAARFLELLGEKGCNIVGFPLQCLGHLAEPSTFAVLRNLLAEAEAGAGDDDDPEVDDVLEAIASFRTKAANDVLAGYLDHEDPELASHVAAMLMERSRSADPELEARCVETIGGCLRDGSAHYVAARFLPSVAAGMTLVQTWLRSEDAPTRAAGVEAITEYLQYEDDPELTSDVLARCPEEVRVELEGEL